MRTLLGLGVLALTACSVSYSSRPLDPPPPPGSRLPSGWEWPAQAAPAPAPGPVAAGMPRLQAHRPVLRPFDAARLRARAKKTKGCKPMELGPGKWVMPDCGQRPVMALSPTIAPRNKMGFQGQKPDSVDLRAMGLDGPVKDQQQVGVCWAFTISTLMENSLRRGGKLDVVSPLHIVAEDAWDDLHMKGKTDGRMVIESAWPYDPAKACKLKESPKDVWCEDAYHVEQGSWRQDPGLASEKERANQIGVYPITKIQKLGNPRAFDELAEVLASGQAIYMSFNIDQQTWSRPPGGVIPDWQTGGEYRHAVAAVGYRSTPQRQLLVHNSWGADWGAGGYAWISEPMVNQHVNDAFVIDVEGGGTGSGMGIPGVPGFQIPGVPGFQVPGIPGLPWPGTPGGQQGGSTPQQQPSSCAAGQVQDVLTRACAAACANGMPPANGFCLP
jgi:hypothetical protein